MAALDAAAYGGAKDASAAWGAGRLALEDWLAVSAVRAVPEAFQEQWQERVAIMTADGGVPKVGAQRLAWTHLQASGTPAGHSTFLETL